MFRDSRLTMPLVPRANKERLFRVFPNKVQKMVPEEGLEPPTNGL